MENTNQNATEDPRPRRWAEEYPEYRRDQITAAYRMAVAVIQTEDWEQSSQLREDAQIAIKEYMEMRTEWRLLRQAWQVSNSPNAQYS